MWLNAIHAYVLGPSLWIMTVVFCCRSWSVVPSRSSFAVFGLEGRMRCRIIPLLLIGLYDVTPLPGHLCIVLLFSRSEMKKSTLASRFQPVCWLTVATFWRRSAFVPCMKKFKWLQVYVLQQVNLTMWIQCSYGVWRFALIYVLSLLALKFY